MRHLIFLGTDPSHRTLKDTSNNNGCIVCLYIPLFILKGFYYSMKKNVPFKKIHHSSNRICYSLFKGIVQVSGIKAY